MTTPAEHPVRRQLTRDRIVEAAIVIVRAEGLPALSMRRIAAELGAGAMSLYRHVADRDDLLLAMMDHVARTLTPPPAQKDDRAEVAAIMKLIHQAFRTDPWLVHVLLFEGRGSLLILPLLERVFQALGRLGHDAGASINIYSMLMHYAYGESLSYETRVQRLSHRQAWPEDAFAAYPAAGAVMSAATDWPYDEFERNIHRMLMASEPTQAR